MSGVEVTLETVDERKVTVPSPASVEDTRKFASFVSEAGQDGYHIASAHAITRDHGNQRDPDVRTHGIRFVFRKGS